MIASSLNLHSTSFSRAIKRHRLLVERSDKLCFCSTCSHHWSCSLHFRCGHRTCQHLCDGCKFLTSCDVYLRYPCRTFDRYPHVCNGCSCELKCKLRRFIYHAGVADMTAHAALVSSRSGFNLPQNQYDHLNQLMYFGLVDKRQSIHHFIQSIENQAMPFEKTIYRYIDSGQFSTRNHHLLKKVTLKPRQKSLSIYAYPENKNINRPGRLLKDWLVYQRKFAIIDYWQMDFLGKPHASSKEVLVLTIPVLSFTLLYLLEDATAAKVQALFDAIEANLGTPLISKNCFLRFYPIVTANLTISYQLNLILMAKTARTSFTVILLRAMKSHMAKTTIASFVGQFQNRPS